MDLAAGRRQNPHAWRVRYGPLPVMVPMDAQKRKEATHERGCSAGFQTCCIADFQVGRVFWRSAGLETRDTADLEVCATLLRVHGSNAWHQGQGSSLSMKG